MDKRVFLLVFIIFLQIHLSSAEINLFKMNISSSRDLVRSVNSNVDVFTYDINHSLTSPDSVSLTIINDTNFTQQFFRLGNGRYRFVINYYGQSEKLKINLISIQEQKNISQDYDFNVVEQSNQVKEFQNFKMNTASRLDSIEEYIKKNPSMIGYIIFGVLGFVFLLIYASEKSDQKPS